MRLVGFVAVLLVVAVYGLFQLVSVSADVDQYRKYKTEPVDYAAITNHARGLTTDEAYGKVPHQRTPFRDDLGRMSGQDVQYLSALFSLTDAGVVERVYVQERLVQGDLGARETNYQSIMAGVRTLSTPEKLLEVEALIFEALGEQARYLELWRQSGRPQFYTPRATLVQSSHGKLIAAYNILMKLYPDEGSHNKKAFFDHLCSLDFI